MGRFDFDKHFYSSVTSNKFTIFASVMLKNFICILFCMSCTIMTALPETLNFRFVHITNNNGLPQNHVTCIMQDHKGLMWLGTKNGLCRYNGYEMQTYFHDITENNTLSHNFVRSIFQDRQKRIWIGTDKGICRYLPDKDEFVQYEIQELSVTSIVQNNDSKIFCCADVLYYYDEVADKFFPVTVGVNNETITGAITLATDKHNMLWIGGNRGLVGYNAGFTKSNEVNIMDHNNEQIINDNVISLFIDDAGNIWIGKNGNGIISYNPSTFQTTFYKDKKGIPNGVIRSIEQDNQGRMWFGTEKGISVLKNNNTFENIQQNYNDRFGLNDNAIYSIEKDRDGNMWVGTYFGGVNVFYPGFEQFKYYDAGYSENQLKGKAVRQIIQETDNILWMATEDGGLHKFDKETGIFYKISDKNICSDNIHSLQIDAENNLWIGTFWGGLTRYNLQTKQSKYFNTDNSALPVNNIFALYVDSRETVWLGTSFGLRCFNKKNNSIEEIQNGLLSDNFIYCITEDRNGNLWIGLRSKGLVCYNIRQGIVRNWDVQAGSNALSDNFVTSVLEDFDGRIWVGTNNGGLYLYSMQSNDFRSLLSEGIIPEQCIYALLEDNDGDLWITTNNGLISYDYHTGLATKYTTEDGLPTNHFNFTSAFMDNKGIVYLGTVQGMVSFDPKNVKQKTNFPNIVFTGLTIGDKSITPNGPDSPLHREFDNTSKIILNHKQAQLFGIEYAGISLGHTRNIIYAMQMEGLNPEWQVVNTQRRIVFSGLPAGKYIFRVKASSSKNTWDDSNIRSIEIEVKPPFYLSVWAYVAYSVLILIVIASVIKFYYKRLEEKNAIRVNRLEKEKLEEMNELKRNFFTNISHEFKTPLTLIMAPVRQIIGNADTGEKNRKKLELVLKNSNSLMNLLNELIDFNKIESDQVQIKLQKGNPLGFIREICNRFYALALEDEIKFEVEIEDLEEEVWFSLSSVEKIINNLLSNAFKYTPKEGKVKFSASIVENEKEELFLKIVVEDTGIGIAKENLEKIFEAYYREGREGVNKNPSWGIGLTLTKSLAHLHKGDISITSELGKGSVFTTLLNVSPDAFPEKNKLELRANPDYLEKYNYSSIVSEEQRQFISKNGTELNRQKKNEILIVEDNVEMLKFLIDLFSEKYDVKAAQTGLEALKQMEEKLPDLLISDIMMPEMNGMDLCRQVKSNMLTSHIPVILLTAKTGTENIIKGYEFGADVYVEKPFDPSSLLLQVQNLLRTRDYNRQQFKESIVRNIGMIAKNKYDEKLLNDIQKVVEENLSNEEFNVSDVIKSVGVSRTMLHVKLKSMLDMSIGDYIRNIRIEKAKELLLQGNIIADTAYSTGFSDPNYFSKCFKKQTGKTPSEFIKENIS